MQKECHYLRGFTYPEGVSKCVMRQSQKNPLLVILTSGEQIVIEENVRIHEL